MKLALGLYDAPEIQKQPIFYVDNTLNNIAIFGGPMTGKTTLIKTLLVRMHEYSSPFKENIYIIDFGGNIGSFGKMEKVCACFDSSNEENIKRIFKTIEQRLEENATVLGSANYYSMASKNPDNCPTHLTLIIEGLNTFLSDDRYTTYNDLLIKFCRDGLSKGLSVIVTANELSGIGKLLSSFGQKIAFDMPTDSYYEIFNSKVTPPMKISGRGIVNIDSDTFEFQAFLPFESADEVEREKRIDELIEKTNNSNNKNLLVSFDDIIEKDNISSYCTPDQIIKVEDTEVILGLDYYSHDPVVINIKENRSIAIYGKRDFGKTNLLYGILEGIYQYNNSVRFVFLDDGREQVKPLYEKYRSNSDKLFYNSEDFHNFLWEEGYLSGSREIGEFSSVDYAKKNTPFTVFVIQGKSFFQASQSRSLFPRIEEMLGRAEQDDYMFVFSDVKIMPEVDSRVRFNNFISVAFLLDNIGDFVGDRGNGNKSVFGDMDSRELKSEYAKCSKGDGYCYFVDKDKLCKLKFFKFKFKNEGK